MTGFTIDVIASTSFATETNANDDRNSANSLLEKAEATFQFGKLKIIYFLLIPRSIRKLINNYLVKEWDNQFFIDLVKQVIKQRRETSVKRNDFVQLLMDARVSENEIASQDLQKLTASEEMNGKLWILY